MLSGGGNGEGAAMNLGGMGANGAVGGSMSQAGAATSAGDGGSSSSIAGAGAGGEANQAGASSGETLPSCVGETGTECDTKSCCTSIAVPGGSFLLGDVDDLSAQPEHIASVSSFMLDEYEVTVGRFRRFVAQFGTPIPKGAGALPKIPKSGWEEDGFDWNHPSWWAANADDLKAKLACTGFPTWTNEPGAGDEKPINCVTWWEAFAFCAWDGGRLPTEAEWEYAAAGGSENRAHPWGSAALDVELLSYNAASGGTPGVPGASDIVAVGSTPKGNGRWGHADLAGSVQEWVRDAFSATYYAGAGNTCNDCAYLNGESADRVQKGGSWVSAEPSIVEHVPGNRSTRTDRRGFRCARNL
jgi:sulfatase modifying factor 1